MAADDDPPNTVAPDDDDGASEVSEVMVLAEADSPGYHPTHVHRLVNVDEEVEYSWFWLMDGPAPTAGSSHVVAEPDAQDSVPFRARFQDGSAQPASLGGARRARGRCRSADVDP